jgi:hypothetical protein
MEGLTREALFEAIRRRHHYGTTGNRIYMDVHARFATPALVYPRDPLWFDVQPEKSSKTVMGDIAQVSDTDITVSVEIESSVAIERVELYDTTTLLDTIRFYTEEDLQGRIRILWEGAEYKGRGRTVYWNGGLDLQNNSINHFSPINFKNIEKLPSLLGNKSLSWNSVTTGNFLGIDLWLDDYEAGTLSFQTNQLTFDLPVCEIGMDDQVFNAGGLGKRVRIFRLPTKMEPQKYYFERLVPIRSHGDTRIYIKVIFEDGHAAWSSPMYFFK